MFTEPTTPINKFTPKGKSTSHWDTYPDDATSECQEGFPIVHIDSGTKIANGYTSIVTIGMVKVFHFLELTDTQVIRSQFQLVRETEDRFAAYQEFRLPCGFKARRYVTDDNDMRANYWYFPLTQVAPGKVSGANVSQPALKVVNQ
jgi:hypothetical protein